MSVISFLAQYQLDSRRRDGRGVGLEPSSSLYGAIGWDGKTVVRPNGSRILAWHPVPAPAGPIRSAPASGQQ